MEGLNCEQLLRASLACRHTSVQVLVSAHLRLAVKAMLMLGVKL